MSSTLRRGVSLEEPELPSGRVELQPPPELAPHEGIAGALMMALPMLGSVGAIVFVSAAGGGRGGTNFIAAGMFLVATLGFVVVNVDRQRKQRGTQMHGQRREYLQYLATVRREVRGAADQQRHYLLWNHPEPAALPTLAEEGTRLWDRTTSSDDYLHVRYGRTSQPLAIELAAPEAAPIDQVDPVAASALHRFLSVHRVQPDLPAALDLTAFSRVEVVGPREKAAALARALVCSATAFQSPDQLLVVVLCEADRRASWEWVKWLPHAQSPVGTDAIGPERLVVTSVEDAVALLPEELRDRPRFGAENVEVSPHVLVVVDGDGLLPPGNHLVPEEGAHGMTVLDLPRRAGELTDPTVLRLAIADTQLAGGVAMLAERSREGSFRAIGDQLDEATAEAFARRLAPLYTVDGPVRDDTSAKVPEIGDLLGLGAVHDLDLDRSWRRRPERDRLRVPIGVGDNGAPVFLDIKESAQQGMGPHGLVIGATGSGKSEFLRTLVLGLAMTHSSETLNMVLVDFKGGATFAGLSQMPHVSAVITNLENELTLVDRMQDALSGEMVRRQEVLREAGNFASVRDYEKARADGADLAPLPSLFIVVDEFSEMLSAKPEFIDLFVAIGRLGRSLGLHLLLASQRLEEGRLRGLDSHLSYRVGLRTFSAAESRSVLGVADAYELPSVPGLGYLKPDQSTLLRFKASYVSGPPPRRSGAGQSSTRARAVLPFTLDHVLAPLEAEPVEVEPVAPVTVGDDQASTLDIAVSTMVGEGLEAHKVWLPPLDAPDTLDGLFDDLVEHDELGLHSPSWRARPGLQIPLGTVDRPREQRRDTLVVDLAGAGGHVAVVGGPRSGKSTLLRTVVSSMALARTPNEAQFYVLDFGGGTFSPLADLPHVSGVATRSEPDVVRRVAAEVGGVVDAREQYFRRNGIDSIETYRSLRAQGRADDGYGDLFLVIDGWSTLRAEFDELETELQVLAQRGLTFGLHLIVASPRWMDFRAAIRDVFGTRLELRLGDASDSEVDRKIAALVPTGRPGRGLTQSKLHYLGALPRIDGKGQPDDLGAGVDDLVRRVAAAWSGPAGPKLRLLPDRISLEEVHERAGVQAGDRRLYLGIDERGLAPVAFDVDSEPHLYAYGDAGSGKSTLLRTYAREVMRTRSTDEAKFLVVDYRRGLLGEVPEEWRIDYVTNAGQATPMLQQMQQFLTNRLPGPDVTAEQLRDRSWWTGADVFVLIDDYDLVASSQGNPVAPLLPLLPQAADVGLHLAITRRAGGASRSFDQVLQTLSDLAMPVMLLPGSPDEGPIVGRLKPKKGVPGRTQLVTRDRGQEVVQLAWTERTM